MVPVPEELVDEVRHYVMVLAGRGSSGGWSDESVERLYDQLDEPARAVVTAIARTTADGELATVTGIAGVTGTSVRDVRGIVLEVTHLFRGLKGPAMPILLLDPTDGPDADRGLDDDHRPIVMSDAGARIVLSVAERR
jgi:hypothetical protein